MCMCIYLYTYIYIYIYIYVVICFSCCPSLDRLVAVDRGLLAGEEADPVLELHVEEDLESDGISIMII